MITMSQDNFRIEDSGESSRLPQQEPYPSRPPREHDQPPPLPQADPVGSEPAFGYGYGPERRMGESGLGIASFIISIVSGLGVFTLFLMAAYMDVRRQGPLEDDSPEIVLIGLGILGAGLLALIGLGLGIAGVAQRSRTRIFAVIGLIFNALIALGMVSLMAVGAAMEEGLS